MALKNQIQASSVYRALGIIGDRTTLIILEYAFVGVKRFGEWQASMATARSTLSNRLQHLLKNGLMHRTRYHDRPRRYEYHLTRMGRELYPCALMGWCWEERWHRHRIAHPRSLYHQSCGQLMQPLMVCSHCGGELSAYDVRYKDGPGAGYESRCAPQRTRRSKEIGADLYTMCDILGDRWAALILAMAFFRIRRFDEMRKQQKIATNILTDRIKRLVKSDLLARRQYQTRPPRHEYVLTATGIDLYPSIIAMLQWGDRWLAAPGKAPLLLTHTPCKRRLRARVVCSECLTTLRPHEVKFQRP